MRARTGTGMPWMGVGVPVGTGDEPFKGGSSLLLLGDCLEAVLGCSGSDSDGYSAGKKRTGVVGAAPETGMRGALKVLKVGAPKHKSN